MLGHLYLTLGFAALLAVVLWEAPVLPIFRVTRRRLIRANADRVWRSMMQRPTDRFVSDDPVEGEPGKRRIVWDASNGNRTSLEISTYETVEEKKGEKLVRHVVADHDIAFKPGAEIVETWQLDKHPDGTLLTLTHERGMLQSISALLETRRNIYGTLDWLQTYCETDAAARAASHQPDPATKSPATLQRALTSIALTLLTAGSLAVLVSWRLAFLMLTIILVHEIGHFIGFRIAGHDRPRLILLPFIGGAVVSDKPFRSAREEAFISLMGPGFSALYGVAFMLVAFNNGADFANIFGVDPGVHYVKDRYVAIMCVGAAALIGIANAFQMIPVPPLDGGHVWRALLHSDRHRFIRYVFPFVAVVVTIVAFATGNLMFGLLIALLCIIWPAAITTRLALPVMSASEKTLIGGAYIAIALIHLAPVYVLVRPFI